MLKEYLTHSANKKIYRGRLSVNPGIKKLSGLSVSSG